MNKNCRVTRSDVFASGFGLGPDTDGQRNWLKRSRLFQMGTTTTLWILQVRLFLDSDKAVSLGWNPT